MPTLYLDIRSAGQLPFAESLRRQNMIVGDVRPDYGIILAFEPLDHTLAVGRDAKPEHFLTPREHLDDYTIVDVDRRGSVTYHGPGSLVMYFLFPWSAGHEYRLQEVLRETALHVGVKSIAGEYPALWVPFRDRVVKVGVVGTGRRRMHNYIVTTHGVDLNVANNPDRWTPINACGLGQPVMNLSALTGEELTVSSIEPLAVSKAAELFTEDVRVVV